MRRLYVILVSAVICLIMSGCETKGLRSYTEDSFSFTESLTTQYSESQEDNHVETDATKAELVVYVCGEVNQEGVYHLPVDSRVVDAVKAAGGFSANADADAINQAEQIKDGEQITIPSKNSDHKNAIESKEAESSVENSEGKIDINHATKEQLMTIPGVGEAKAQSILSYRQENGPFQKIEDIMKITGIKQGVFDKMKNYIIVD